MVRAFLTIVYEMFSNFEPLLKVFKFYFNNLFDVISPFLQIF